MRDSGRGPLLGRLLLALLLLCGATGASARTVKDFKSLLTTKWLSNSELEAWMDDYLARCGSIARKFSLGKSARGRNLWALEISDKPGAAEPEPNFKYIANMHGNEISGRALLPLLAEWLCEANGEETRATRLVRDMHLFLVPTMNPDGYPTRRESRGRGGHGYDLNRNFPDHYRDAGKDLSQPQTSPVPTQPETQAVMAFLLERTWLGGANFHEGELVANYPWDAYSDWTLQWGSQPNPCPDDAVLKRLALTYSTANKAMLQNPSFRSQNGTTNGAAWYPITGGLQDWDYVVAGSMHITLEVSKEKKAPPSAIPRLWDENKESMISLPLAAMIGVRGTVTGPSGPLQATLAVRAAPGADAVPFKSAAGTGFYARPLVPGSSYIISCEAAGFKPQTATFTVPTDGTPWVQDFTLVPAR